MTFEFSSIAFYPTEFQEKLENTLNRMAEERLLQRIWEHDFILWADRPDEITNRLGWLELPTSMLPNLAEINQLVAQVREDNMDTALLLGMGGSSLAPEVFQKISGVNSGYLNLHILDSTDPGAVTHYQSILDLEKTLIIVATKSGGTVETLSFTKYFYNLTLEAFGEERAGNHFIAITDPGSNLERLADKLHFRKTFLNDPNLGGRYSALSFFGLVPAALAGVDIQKLLDKGSTAAGQSSRHTPPQNNPAAVLGALIGIAAKHGRDKLTFLSDDHASPFSDWVEQLIAESTGKSGKGILPVVGEEIADNLKNYGNDRIFVIQHFRSLTTLNQISKDLRSLGYPVIEYQFQEDTDLGYYMYLWEVATSIAGYLLEIHPFNQPNVEAAKILAKNSVSTYEETGKLPVGKSQPLKFEVIDSLLSEAQSGDYAAIQAYVNPTPENESVFRSLQAAIRDWYGIATTFGFGPRFLHSTGQLHKGDGGNGIFLQFVSSSPYDLPIPENPGEDDSFISFGILKRAQALGDAAALEDEGRRILVFDLESPIAGDILAIAKRLRK